MPQERLQPIGRPMFITPSEWIVCVVLFLISKKLTQHKYKLILGAKPMESRIATEAWGATEAGNAESENAEAEDTKADNTKTEKIEAGNTESEYTEVENTEAE